MTSPVIDRLISLVMADPPATSEAETTRLLREATADMPPARAVELIAEFNRSFGMIGLSAIVDPQSQHAEDFRKQCLSILREIPGVAH